MVGQFVVKRPPGPHGAREIYQALKTQIEDGVYGPSDKLPSTRTLANEFGASRTKAAMREPNLRTSSCPPLLPNH
jgi:GntR family transcriptional regulator/MocR family aminotransferase